MWLAGQCAFPPLIPEKPIVVARQGLVLEQRFQAPVDKRYLLELQFAFPSTEARIADTLVGSWGRDPYCDSSIEESAIPPAARKALGEVVSLRVVVRTRPGGPVVTDKTFHSRCNNSMMSNVKGREVGWLTLTRGEYFVQVYNQSAQPAFTGVRTSLALVAGSGK